MSIAERIQQLQDRLHRACEDANRSPSEVRMLAASKTVGIDAIQAALGAGHRLFGESRAQELRDKGRQLAEHPLQPEWHFIGHLQRNKIKYLVGRVSLIHTLDRLSIGEAIAQRMERDGHTQPMPVLVEVNLGSEWSKSGVEPSQALDLCAAFHDNSYLSLQGLMAIPPWNEDPSQSTPYFEQLAELAEAGRKQGLPLTELSMGMSHDFEYAIASGATIIRLGTAIFGARTQ